DDASTTWGRFRACRRGGTGAAGDGSASHLAQRLPGSRTPGHVGLVEIAEHMPSGRRRYAVPEPRQGDGGQPVVTGVPEPETEARAVLVPLHPADRRQGDPATPAEP